MKYLILIAVLMCGSLMAGERVILKDSKVLTAEINNTTVLCSSLGYGMKELKINIAGLDGFTILDHSNIRFGDREGLPCMTAGACKRVANDHGFSIQDIIQNNPRNEEIIVHRELKEVRYLTERDGGQVCTKALVETLDTVVAGIPFFHQRSSVTDEFLPASACKF